jgi:hypothetical protein
MTTEPLSSPPESPFSPQPASHLGFADSWRRVITDPSGFFADMPHSGGLQEPLVFLGVCAVLNAVGSLLFGWGVFGAVWGAVGFVLGAFVAGIALTLIAQQLFDGRAGFEQMFRVVAYAAAPLVFLWVPRLWPFALVYAWFLQVRGVQRVNDFEAVPAVLTVMLKTGVLLLVLAALRGWRF